MANNVRFLDQVSVSAFGNTGGGGSSISSSYAETASFAHFATSASYSVSSSHSSFAISASYAVSASHEIIKEVSSSHADTASFAQSGNGIFSGSFSGSYVGDGSGLTGVEPFPYTGSALITGSLTLIGPALFTSVVPESHVTIDSTTGTELYFSGSSNANITSDGPVYFKTLSSLGYFFGVNNTDERVLIGNQNNATANTRLVIDSLGRGISSSLATSTASFGTYIGDGSQLTGIIHTSASYADTASFAQSGNGIFSGSFSGSYVGDGSGLTGVEPFPFSGSAVITGSLVISGSNTVMMGLPNAADRIAIGGNGNSFHIQHQGVGNPGIGDPIPPVLTISGSGGTSGGNQTINIGSRSSTTPSIGDETIVRFNFFTGGRLTTLVGGTPGGNAFAFSVSGSSFNGNGGIISLGRGGTTPSNSAKIHLNGHLTASAGVNISASATSTASFGTYLGDGSQLTGIDHDSGSWDGQFTGDAVITGSLTISGSSKPLEIIGSGSTVFSVVGSLGELFAIDDVLSGSLLVVNDISGLPQFEVLSDGRTLIGSDPRSLYTTATINATLAATSESIYSLSTSSYDGVFFDYTVNSASNARAGNIMSVWNGGNLVYTENTTTDIGSTVGVIFNVEISQSQAQLISVTDTAGWKIKTTIRSI